MSGVLRAVSAVASVVAVVAPFFGPVGVIVGAVAAAVSVVAGVGAQLTAKKPSNDRQGSQLTFKIDPGGALPYVMGLTAVAGSIAYRDTYGPDNKYQTFVSVLSAGGPIGGIDDFLADKASVPFSGSAATGFYGGFMWQTRQLGATPEAGVLSSGTATAMPNWGSGYKLSGLAASAWTLQFDSKSNHYTSGEPAPLWVVRGVKVYDPRLDSTYPGGSGACRWADPSDTVAHAAARATWVYSDSPALHGLKWRLGVWERDEGDSGAEYQKIMGIGAPIDLIDLPAIVAAANVQDANGWTIGGQIDSSQDKWEVLKLIEETGGCEPIAVGAMMSTLVKAPRTPRRTITANDLADGKLSAPAMRRRSDRINGYRASFRSEAHGWVITPIDIIQVPDYVAEDGREKTGSGTFSLCQDANQAAELAAYEVFDSRELEPIVLPLKPLAAGDRLGDCLTIDIPELGLEGVDAVVRGKQTDPQTGIVTLTLRSETAGKHAAALGLTGETPATPTLTAPPEVVATPDGASWALTAELVSGTSVATPVLKVVGAVENITADAVLFEYREDGASDWVSTGVEPPDTILKRIRGVDPATDYEVAIRYRVRGVLSDRLVLGPVTTASRDVVGGLAAFLTNESHTLPAASDGTVSSYAGATGDFEVFVGLNDVSSDFALSTPSGGNPQVLTVGYVGQTFTVTAGLDAGEAAATLTIRATGSGAMTGIVIDKVFSLAKSQAGDDGTPPALISLSASAQQVNYDKTGAFVAGQTITLTSVQQNSTATPIWSLYRPSGVLEVDGPAAALVATYPTLFTSTGADSLTILAAYLAPLISVYGSFSVAVAIGSVTDRVSVVKVQDGADGPPGDDGAPGISALKVIALPNPISVACTAGGTPKAGIPSFDVSATQAGSDVTGSLSYGTITSSGMTGVSRTGNTVSATGMSADTGTITVPGSAGGSSDSVTVGFTKVKDGVAFVADSATVTDPASASYVVCGSVTLLMGPGGNVGVDSNGFFSKGVGGGTIDFDGYIEYSVNGGGYSTLGAVTSTPGIGAFSSGSWEFTGGISGASLGLSSRVPVTFRMQGKRVGTAYASFDGNLNIAWQG